MSHAPRQSLGRIFAAPALIALASVTGLFGALVGDGLWDAASSLCLAIPAVIFGACVARTKLARRRKTGSVGVPVAALATQSRKNRDSPNSSPSRQA